MATQQAEDGGEPSATGHSANTHFFRPNDGIYVSEGPEHRTICVSPHLPAAMARNGDWHVEQFELHKELYRGKTSLLYMATDRISGIQVALKLYRKRKLSVLNRYQVEREVRLHINLQHENIIHLFAAFEDEKHVYMVQEFAVCGDLFEDLKKGGGQLKEKYAVRDVIVPFLSALSYLHGQGIIHRDIKPENILLGANKVVKVADFGLSININHERPVTRAGTLDYMAPEVLVCPDKRRPDENKDKVLLGYTAQVDSWAVGILAYELLVGYPPFEQESRAATYEHIMYKEPKYPSWMSEEAKKFIGLALCKNASQRPTIADLMAHSWVQPFMMRHMLPVGATAQTAPGPSRLRNSVSHASDGPGGRDSAMTSSSTNGMVPAPPASASCATSSAQGGATTLSSGMTVGGRLFVPVTPPPAVQQQQASYFHQPTPPQSQGLSGPTTSGTAENGTPLRHSPAVHSGVGGTGGGAVSSPTASAASTGVVHRSAPFQPATHTLKSSISLQAHGPTEQVFTGGGGEGGRLHDSISDPTARTYELHNPHPPGAASAASLYGAAGSRSGGGMAEGSGGGAAVVRSSQTMTSGAPATSLSLSSRLGTAAHPHPATRVPPPPLTFLDPHAATEASSSELSPVAHYSGDYLPVSLAGPLSRLGSAHASRPLPQASGGAAPSAGGMPSGTSGSGQNGPASAPPRHRMASVVVPPVNMSAVTAATAAASAAAAGPGGVRLPAPPISPKPMGAPADVAPGFHRPASGVLSDDSFLPPARTPSMSLGSQLLSPLQAQLLAPRPSSRLNSPSHSRRNSVSQAGQQPSQQPSGGGPHIHYHSQTSQHFLMHHVSTPLPQLSGDYVDCVDDPGLKTSNSLRNAGGAINGGVGGVGGVANKMFGKFWARDPVQLPSGGGAGACNDMTIDGPTAGLSFSSRSGGGAASPIIRSAGGGGGVSGGARVRMMTPPTDDMRPLMRESSISSSFKSSGGGSLRDDLTQQSMTIYHRPGKVPGVGRAALAAREAEAVEAAGGGGGNLAKAKSLVNRNLNGVLNEEAPPLARLGSEVALARTAVGPSVGGSAGPRDVASQRSFTSANSAFARKLANGAIATKVTEYVRGRMPHDEDMAD